METTIEFKRITSDLNGNPRYVCHFLNLIKPEESKMSVNDKYHLAIKRANKIGGRKYNTKTYGGGIVFQAYCPQDAEKRILDILKD